MSAASSIMIDGARIYVDGGQILFSTNEKLIDHRY